MSVATNRGLKLHLNKGFVFALAARLSPRYDAFSLFQCTEGIEKSTSFFFVVSAFLTLFLGGSLLQLFIIPLICSSLQLVEKLARSHTVLSRLLMPLFRYYAFIVGYGLIMGSLLTVAFVYHGIKGVGVILFGQLIKTVIDCIVAQQHCLWYIKRQNVYGYGLAEQSFVYAYQYLAQKIGADMSIHMTDEEEQSIETAKAYVRYSLKFPQCVARYKKDMFSTFEFDDDVLNRARIEVMKA